MKRSRQRAWRTPDWRRKESRWMEEITVEEGHVFVLGDNRNNSEDSRSADIGNVKREDILGKAWFIIAPGERFGFLR